MPKSRKRRFGLTSSRPRKTQGVSGNPAKRPAGAPDAAAPGAAERLLLASALLRRAASVPLADPVGFAALPPLTRNALRAQGLGAPAVPGPDGPVTECLLLAGAYAALGIDAQVRGADLTVTDVQTRAETAHAGHAVVWLPERRHLIDPGAERYAEIASLKAGPVVAAAGPADPARPDDGAFGVTVTRGHLMLGYALGSLDTSAGVVAGAAGPETRDAARDAGANLASEVIWLLAAERTEADVALIPYPRAVALVSAVRGLDRRGDVGGDVTFVQRGSLPGTEPARIGDLLPETAPGAAG